MRKDYPTPGIIAASLTMLASGCTSGLQAYEDLHSLEMSPSLAYHECVEPDALMCTEVRYQVDNIKCYFSDAHI